MAGIRTRIIALLKWSERFTKTDMVYLGESAFWTNLSVVLTSLLAFGISVAFANLVPKEVFGLYQYFLSLATIVGALTMTGMNAAVTQAVARGHEGVLKTSVRLQLRLGIIPAGLGLAAALYYLYQGNTIIALGLALISAVTPLTNALNTYNAFLNGKKDFKRLFTTSATTNAVYYGGILIAIVLAPDALILIGANLLLNAVTGIWMYRRVLQEYAPNNSDDSEALSYGTHLSIMNVLDILVVQADAVLIFHFLGAVPLAIYNFACAIPERIGGLFKFISIAALPRFAQSSSEEIATTLISKTLRAMLAGLILALAYIAIAPFLFHFLFPKYLEALPYTQIYAFMIVATAGSMPFTALISQRLQKELYLFRIVSPLMHLALQVGLLYLWGLVGILLARILANFINVGLALLLFLVRARKT